LGPAKSTTPSAGRPRIGVYIGAAMSMPWWKCAQSPTGGSEGKPVHPNSWVITPLSGQISVPLNTDGTFPKLALLIEEGLDPGRELALGLRVERQRRLTSAASSRSWPGCLLDRELRAVSAGAPRGAPSRP